MSEVAAAPITKYRRIGGHFSLRIGKDKYTDAYLYMVVIDGVEDHLCLDVQEGNMLYENHLPKDE